MSKWHDNESDLSYLGDYNPTDPLTVSIGKQ
jgi:hypothetical protein